MTVIAVSVDAGPVSYVSRVNEETSGVDLALGLNRARRFESRSKALWFRESKVFWGAVQEWDGNVRVWIEEV